MKAPTFHKFLELLVLLNLFEPLDKIMWTHIHFSGLNSLKPFTCLQVWAWSHTDMVCSVLGPLQIWLVCAVSLCLLPCTSPTRSLWDQGTYFPVGGKLYSTAGINLGAGRWKGRKVRGYSSCKWGQKLKYFTFYSFWRNTVNTERVASPLTHNTQMLKVSYLHLLPCSSSSVEVPSDWTQNSFLRILKPLWSNGSLFSFCHHEWWEELIISIAIWPSTSFCEI